MKPTLFLLAAGMGSRYGGLKTLSTPALENWSLLSVKILNKIFVKRLFLNMKVIFLANWYSRL